MADPECAAQLLNMTSGQFTAWNQGVQTQLSTFNNKDANALQTLDTIDNNLSTALKCLQAEIVRLTNSSSDISTLYDTKSTLQKELKAKHEALTISKERVALLRNPEQKTTIYESWFPLQRPLKMSTLLILLVFGLFFISVATGSILRQLGVSVDIALAMRVPGTSGRFASFINPLTMGLAAALSICLAAIIYLATKKG